MEGVTSANDELGAVGIVVANVLFLAFFLGGSVAAAAAAVACCLAASRSAASSARCCFLESFLPGADDVEGAIMDFLLGSVCPAAGLGG